MSTVPPSAPGTPGLPMVFLDVDGVLNPYAMEQPSPEGFSDFEEHEANGFLLRLSRAMGRRLVALPAELCWATTWAETIDRDVSPYCDLPPGLRVAAQLPLEQAAGATNWKLVQLRRLVEDEERPFVWIDDDAIDAPGPDGQTGREWAGELKVANLLVSPDPAVGLRPVELEAICSFLEGLFAPAALKNP